jgi:hypothetical protein
MTRERELPNTDDLVRRYVAGASVNQLSKELRTDSRVVKRALVRAGVSVRCQADALRLVSAANEEPCDDVAAVVSAYGRGWSVADAASAAGVSWRVAKRHLEKAGVYVERRARTGVAAERLSAHRHRKVGRFEATIGAACLLDGQTPVGPYNVDLTNEALGLAVEVFAARMSSRDWPRLRRRTEEILGRGWFLLFVLVRDESSLPSVAEDVIAYADRLRRGEPLRGKYGVVCRDAKPLPFPRHQLDGLPFVEGP